MAQSNVPPASSSTATTAAQQRLSAHQRLMSQRNAVNYGTLAPNVNAPALEMTQALQPIIPTAPGPGSVINIPFRNVGLIKRVLCKVQFQVNGGGTTDSTLTPLGLANFFSQVIFNDFSGNQRINTTGWHLAYLKTVKNGGWAYGAAFQNDSPFGIANNNPAFTAMTPTDISGNQAPPTVLAAATNQQCQLFIEVPFAVRDGDLRGAIWAAVTQANAQILLTINPAFGCTSTQDPTLSVYQSGGTDLPTISNFSITPYQVYLENLPTDANGNPIVPQADIATAYLLNNTASGPLVQGQDNATAFVNQRKFLSTFMIYDNAGVLNFGGDLNYLELVSANLTPIEKYDPQTFMQVHHRDVFHDDLPRGMYYWDFRRRPIDTDAFGNMQLIVNPSLVTSSASVLLQAWESLGVLGQVNQAPAIPSGGG